MKTEVNAEEKIKAAAKNLFTLKGFDAVKTRDIAELAGINLALVNYYFRSKEKLFELIMKENFEHFAEGIFDVIDDPSTSLFQKIENLVNTYIDMLVINPDMPLFVLNHAKLDSNKNMLKERFHQSFMLKQFQEAKSNKVIVQMQPAHFIFNLLGLVIFPFMGRTVFFSNPSDPEQSKSHFLQLMEERRRMIPLWINAILIQKL